MNSWQQGVLILAWQVKGEYVVCFYFCCQHSFVFEPWIIHVVCTLQKYIFFLHIKQTYNFSLFFFRNTLYKLSLAL